MKRYARAISVVLLIVVVFGGGFLLGTAQPVLLVQAQTGQPPETEDLFRPFWEAWNIVHARFVDIDQVDDNELMEAALTGMLSALGDENTIYSTPAAFARQNEDLQGTYEGIGATVRTDESTGGVRIVSTMNGSPARESLRQGDVILTVDGEDITGLSINDAVARIRGPAGTTVRLGVLRAGTSGILEVDVRRARITREFVTYTVFEGKIGYIAITQFSSSVTDELAQALRAIDANNLNGLVIDFRNDPGGLFDTAINVARQFLNDGTIIVQRGRVGTPEVKHEATGTALAPDVPLVVLVNAGSASASELVAGALQSRGRATVVGEVTFGKGSVQSISLLSNGGGLRVTVSRFFDAQGGAIDGVGIIPDIYVPWTEDEMLANPDYDPQLTEALYFLRNRF
jgi:carboxyl-terminal processing protease